MHAHLNEPFPTLLEIRPDIPPAMDAVVQRACAKNPDDRFASAAALAGALETAVKDGLPPTVASEEAGPAAETVVSPAAPTAATEPEPTRLPPTRVAEPAAAGGPPPARPPRRRGYVLPGLIGVVVVAVVVAVIVLSSGGGSSKNRAATGSTTPAQASTTSTSAPVRQTGSIFTMEVPRNWQRRDNSTAGGLKRTTWTDPGDSRTAVLVDPIPQVKSTPEGRARRVDANLQSTKPRYRRVSLGPATIAGHPGYELIYEISGVRYLDQFVNLDCQDGYAVQGQAPASGFAALSPTFRTSANSLRSKPC
jgi:hypothetical protein